MIERLLAGAHRWALRLIERVWDAPRLSPAGVLLDVLVELVVAYEARYWPIEEPAE